MVGPIGGVREMFSMRLSDETALVSLQLLSSRIRNGQFVLLVDNDGCKHTHIAGYSSNTVANQLVAKASSLECDNLVQMWVAPVPSHSNCADKPSRSEKCSVLDLKVLQRSGRWALAGITTEVWGNVSCS